MLPGPVRISGNVHRATNRRPHHIFRRSTEKKSPLNIQFERQVAALEFRQQEQSQRASPVDLYLALSTSSPHHVENGHSQVLFKSTTILDGLESSLSSSLIFIHFDFSEESLRRRLINSSRPSVENSPKTDKAPDSDFLVNTFTKTSVDANQTTRKKSKKKNKRHKRGPCKKVSDASEMQCRQHKNASPIDVAGGEALTLSSNHVADVLLNTSTPGSEMQCSQGKNTSPSSAVAGGEAFPLTLSPNHVTNKMFKDSSPGSSVREVSVERPDSEIDIECGGSSIASISSTSCSDEMDIYRPTTSDFEFSEQSSSNNFTCLDSASNSTLTDSSTDSHCTDSSWNFSDDAENLLIVRNECLCAPSKLTDSGGFKYGGDKSWVNKSNHGKNFCFKNSGSDCSGTQEVQLCGNAAAGDGNFHLVISRKKARKNRKMQLLGSSNAEHMCDVEHGRNEEHASSSKRMPVEVNTIDCSCRQNNVFMQPQHGVASKDFTRDFIDKPSKVRTWIPREVTLNDYMTGTNLNCLSDPEHCRREPQKYPSLSEVADSGFSKEKNASTTKMQPGIVHSRETDSSQMAWSSGYDLVVQKVIEQTCTSRGLPTQHGEPQVLVPEDDDAIETGSRLPSSRMADTLDPLNNSSCIDPKEQKKVENTVANRPCSMQGDLHTQVAGSQSLAYTTDYWKTSRPAESGLKVGGYGLLAVEGNCNFNQQKSDSPVSHLAEMIKAANEAYKVQVASDVHLISGHPIANFETFIHSATPVIGQISCIRSGNCLQDWPVGNTPCQYQTSNIFLRSVWEWYEEPGSYGLEVEIHRSISSTRSTCSGSEFCAYFIPSLSAIQLFGHSRKNLDHKFDREDEDFLLSQTNGAHLVQDHGELLFEYFESEQPSLRPPLFEKIKQLVCGVNLSGYQIFGDPKKLENLKLCDLHPASWFCVAWYPICCIPQGNCRASFLTYHSLGKLVPQTCSPDMAGRLTHVVSPVVGLWSYNDKDEQWFQLRDPEIKPMSLNDAPQADCAEVLKERLRTLRRCASVMASAVIPKANGESMNHHPDYEFFRNRSN